MSHKSWQKGLLILEGIRQHHTGQARLFHIQPSLGGMPSSPWHSSCLIFFPPFFSFPFLSSVSRAPGCLIQQQRGRSTRARRRGLSVEHEVQESYTRVRLPLPGTKSNVSFLLDSPPSLCPTPHCSWQAWNTANHPRCSPSCHLLCSPPCLHSHCEFTMLAFTSTTSVHKHMFVRRRRRPVARDLNGIRALQQD